MDLRKISAYLQMCTVSTTGVIRHILCCDCMVMECRPKKLLDQLREVIRLKHYAYRTEETYVQWVRRFSLFQEKRHPREPVERLWEHLKADLKWSSFKTLTQLQAKVAQLLAKLTPEVIASVTGYPFILSALSALNAV
ncbi:phage integrase N-terminal SAM-like domain-containing protein [Coleofasciculus sp. H7-2]|uniref:phage integrase N-terminal SAM-like domain-containing protein n=1 Tax=Coleofasciculus sp. H7-2 TaxID=3351545 RepID=UPI00366AC221